MAESGELQPFSLRDEETICFIPNELRAIVQRILHDTPDAVAAVRELYEKVDREDCYLIASAVYDFLWKRVPFEKRRKLYPIVGDFFLTALERNLGRIGPNNMSSCFRELMECYQGAGDLQRMLEGPLYCADLFLLKTTQLALGGRTAAGIEEPEAAKHDRQRAEFLSDEKLSTQDQMAHSLELSKETLLDSQSQLARINKHQEHGLNPAYLQFIRSTLDRLSLSWQQWKEMHERTDILTIEPEQYFKQGIARAEKVNSLVLAALLLEQVGEEYQDKMCRTFLDHRFSNRSPDHPLRGCTFDAAEVYRDQGIIERSYGAYVLAERRFTRSITLFGHLHDRTSIAQTLIERARLYMLRKSELWRARADLYLAVQNIAAVQKRLPPGAALPTVPAAQVLAFYESKGLSREAEVYRGQEAALQT